MRVLGFVVGRVVVCTVLSIAVLVAPSTLAAAQDDPFDEIEHRLKTANVPPPLRKRIHAGIERGVAYLLEQQRKDGAIIGKEQRFTNNPVGYTTIAGLALAHSGGADARRGADRVIDWLIREKGGVRARSMTQTYEIGLLAMLLKARMRHPDVAEQIIVNISRGIDPKTAWWGYTVASGERGTPFLGGGDAPNMSTTQFAGLGLWAASKTCKKSPRSVWRAHLSSLLRAQTESGSWGYSPHQNAYQDFAEGYPCGTFMGYANLMLAKGALDAELRYDPLLAARLEIAERRGLEAMQVAIRVALDGERPKFPLGFYYYTMYAMEKACVFTDSDALNDMQWYVVGAQHILALQHENGGWGRGPAGVGRGSFAPAGDPEVLTTSFALLFLLRTSEVYRPTTPRSVPTPPAAITGRSAEQKRSPERAEPEPPAHVTVTQASQMTDRLVRMLRDEDTQTRHYVEALEELGHALSVISPDVDHDAPTAAERAADDAAVAAVRERVERALLRAFERFAGTGPGPSEDVAVAAANALQRASPAAAEGLRKFLRKRIRGNASGFPSMERLIAAMRAIATSAEEGHVQWLTAQIDTAMDPSSVRRSRAALIALGAVRLAPGEERRVAVRTLVKSLSKLEARAAEKGHSVEALAADHHWRALSAPALFALNALARDPTTGDEPALESGLPPMTMVEFSTWYRDHKQAGALPWQPPR